MPIPKVSRFVNSLILLSKPCPFLELNWMMGETRLNMHFYGKNSLHYILWVKMGRMLIISNFENRKKFILTTDYTIVALFRIIAPKPLRYDSFYPP